jgi:SAM-dependent methyltransferase
VRHASDRQCLVCGSSRFRPAFTESGIDILRCVECGHVFSSYCGDPHYSGFWGDEVEQNDHEYWSRARARMHKDFLYRFVAGRSGRLLDMGCGLGFFVKTVSVHPGWTADGCEISQAAVTYARETLKLDQVACARLEDAPWPPGSFDLVTMWDVLDHIAFPDPVLSRCHSLLKDGGVLFIRTPNVSVHLPRARLNSLVWGERPGVGYLQPRDHLHHYSAATLRRLLQRNGFSQLEYMHLHPIDSTSPHRRLGGRIARSLWFHTARGLSAISGGRANIDNLFVAARK